MLPAAKESPQQNAAAPHEKQSQCSMPRQLHFLLLQNNKQRFLPHVSNECQKACMKKADGMRWNAIHAMWPATHRLFPSRHP
jgi:hypothetical protein